jgi:cytochrome P450
VLRHTDVDRVLKDPATFSSSLGGTQMRDPRTEEDLAYVRRMMLNMDPPEHSRLRRLLAKSFTPKAIGALEAQVHGHVDGILDRMLAGAQGFRGVQLVRAAHRSGVLTTARAAGVRGPATSPRTSRPTCRCSPSPTSWGCRRRTAG